MSAHNLRPALDRMEHTKRRTEMSKQYIDATNWHPDAAFGPIAEAEGA